MDSTTSPKWTQLPHDLIEGSDRRSTSVMWDSSPEVTLTH